MLLPNEYQEVEYIQSSGTQYIDTGVYGNQNTTIEAKFSVNGKNGDWDKYYGSYGTSSDGFYSMFLQSNNPSDNKIRVVNYCNNNNRKYVDSSADLQFNQLYTTRHSNTEFYVNGVLQGTMSSTTFTTSYTIYIFGLHSYESGGVVQLSSMKLYSFNMYDGQTLVREFIPCYRKSDGEIGLYDLVNSVFYTNQGTGTFTKGADVNGYKIKRVLIWQNGEEKQIYPATWKPDASRTLLYLPLESDTNDYSGNNRTTSATSVTFTTVGGVPSAHIGSTGGISVSPDTFITHDTPYKTTSILIYVTSTSSSSRFMWEWAKQDKYHFWGLIPSGTNLEFGSNGCGGQTVSGLITNSWMHLVQTIGDGYIKLYINGTLVDTQTYSSGYPRGNWPNSYQQSQTIFNDRNGTGRSNGLNGNARELIFEQALWSETDVSNYYNRIKNKLGF